MDESNPYKIRPAEEPDLADMVELERACGLNSGGVERFDKLLQEPGMILLVALDADSRGVIGLFSGRVVVDELQIDNVAVREDCRRSGIGSALLKTAMAAAAGQGAVSAVLEVRSSNLAGQKLYENHGFSLLSVRRAYYRAPVEDALMLNRLLNEGLVSVSEKQA
jgi:ribosomal-protein-alanine N-acetyltransferase